MLSGRRLDLLDPSPLDVEIGDIAHGLARVARWNGQTEGDHVYSVAQHSLLVERLGTAAAGDACPPEWSLFFLLHDAPEYVVGDVIAPLKAVLGDAYKSVEARVLSAIHLRFSLPASAPEAARRMLKQADRAAAFAEAVRLAGFSLKEATQVFGKPPLAVRQIDSLLTPAPAKTAQAAFLKRFEELDSNRARG
jgi:hypothetical protein